MSATLPPGLPPEPDLDALGARYAELGRDLDRPAADAASAVLRAWDGIRRELRTYETLTRLRFDQDTADPAARAARERMDVVRPALTALDDTMKRRFLDGGARAAVEPRLGPQAFALWEADLAAFAPAIADDLVDEAGLTARYGALLAGIEVEFAGEKRNLAGLHRFAGDPDRAVRHGAMRARWDALGAVGEELDGIYDDLVRVRTRMALTLGYGSYTELGYRRMQRIGYGPEEVARWRDAIVEHVVPLAAALVRDGAARLGVDRVRMWDEKVVGGDHVALGVAPDAVLRETVAALEALDPRLGAFAAMMERRDLTDVLTRGRKRSGAYCTFVPALDAPIVFANGSGAADDVRTLAHELGHGFQMYSSRALPVVDYVVPTLDAAEIHSMSLEYLVWPHLERFFGAGAAAFRREHLSEALLFFAYGAAIDHFQHLVYARPEATPAERHAMWQAMERRYLPWRDYGDLARPASGGFWQVQQHVYTRPFYYIDYTLALCCALQLWSASHDDPAGALARYVALCARGGEAEFGSLVASAGLRSPFEPATLAGIAARAAQALAR